MYGMKFKKCYSIVKFDSLPKTIGMSLILMENKKSHHSLTNLSLQTLTLPSKQQALTLNPKIKLKSLQNSN
jgi:hypothetical protein